MPRAPQKNVESPPGATDVESGDGLGVDAILDRLEHAVRDLEGGELPLERALERFEQGVHLARRGNLLLDRVEQRVEMLLADRDETVPLPTAADDEDVP